MPEVENIVVGIKDFIENKKIVDVEIIKGDVIKSPSSDEYKKLLQNRIIKSLKRRGKYIIMSLDDGRLNIIHLRMGQALPRCPAETESGHPGSAKPQ